MRVPFLKRLIAAAPLIVGITLATQVVEYLGFFERFETASLDAFLLLRPRLDPAHVVVVGINDDDYATYFGSASPLDSAGVKEMVQAIADGQPLVIGVDLDTSTKTFRDIELSDAWPPIVWGQDALQIPGKFEFTPFGVLGGSGPRRPRDRAGIAQLPQDDDGIVRRYHRTLPLPGGEAATFPWAIIESCCGAGDQGCCKAVHNESHSSEHGVRLNFAGQRFDFTPLSIAHILEIHNEAAYQQRGILHGKIAILGGFYHAARDNHVTPVGAMSGAQLMAQTIETELTGGGIGALNRVIATGLDVLAGIAVVLIQWRFRLRTAVLLNLLSIPLFCAGASYLAFSTFAHWFNFVPVLVGVFVHELYHHAEHYRHLLESAHH